MTEIFHQNTTIMNPGIIHLHPEEKFHTPHRLWQGCPTIERTPGGRLLAGWYSGGMCEPDMRNYNLLVRSDDQGKSWSEPILVIESALFPGIRCIDIQLWYDPNGKLWLFWTQVTGWHTQEYHETWAMTTDDADAEEIQWSQPFFVAPGFLRCRPTVLSDGRWFFCTYTRFSERYEYSITADQGKTWERCYAAVKIPTDFDESMLLEQQDGSLTLFARTANQSGHLAQCTSTDGGKSWSEATSTPFIAPSSRFFIARLKSGRILRVSNHHSKDRINMTAFLSEDDGRTWPYQLLLDNRMHVSYPDAVQDTDGSLWILHDWSRFEEKAIYLTHITEEEIIAGGILHDTSFVTRLVNQPPRHPLFPR